VKYWISVLSILVLLTGCGASVDDQIQAKTDSVEHRLQTLSAALDSSGVTNTAVIKNYTNVMERQRPELKDLMRALAAEATTQGAMYKGLKSRLQDLKDRPQDFIDDQERLDEAVSLEKAVSTEMFNDALSDPINAIADLSNGTLPRVQAISRQAEDLANRGASNRAPGSQMMGNPHYGYWRGSFWEWYGMYSMFSHLTGRPYGYSMWSMNRGYSYYHDVGRRSYSSPKQMTQQRVQEMKTRKEFGRKGKSFASPYSKKRTGASGLSRNSVSQSKGVFKSPYSKSSRGSSFSSSQRNSSSRTSRGISRGK